MTRLNGQRADGNSTFRRYALALAIMAAFLLASRGLYFLISYNPVIFVITGIVVVSWLYGGGPGVAASIFAAAGIRPLFFPNAPFRFESGDAARLVFYLILTAFVSYLVGARRRAEAALLETNSELETRVAERTADLVRSNEELRRSNEDLTRERMKVERANEALRRATADLEQFAYSASHDLQEPIRNIAIYSELIEKRYGHLFDERGLQYVAFVTAGARRMELLVKDLLAYTRTVSGEEKPVDFVDANQVFANAVSNLSEAIRESSAQVTNSPLPRLYIDEIHLQQIFQNLIGNAIKYRSEEQPLVHVSAEESDGFWRFSVQDNGIGIGPEYRERIFGIFKRLHHNGEYAGTGIGLAICRRVVERYGGRIWVESPHGKGSVFYFTVKADERRIAETEAQYSADRGQLRGHSAD